MPNIVKDPLLTSVQTIILLLMGLLALMMAFAAFGAVALLVAPDWVLTHVSAEAAQVAAGSPGIPYAMAGIAVLMAAALYLGFRFLLELRRIVATVDGGDPFVAENADRLQRMAWLSLAGQGLAILVGISGHAVSSHLENANAGLSVNFSSFLIALLLFVLARVFRKGTEMHEELEGTV